MNLKTWRLCVLALALSFTLSPFLLFAQTPSPTPLTIDQTNVPIRVDGHLDDWPSARMIFLNRKDQVTYGQLFWKGEEDFGGRVFLTYDSEFLYVSTIVQKKGRVVNDNDPLSIWNGDCLELFLSTRTDFSGLAHLSKEDFHIGLSPGTDCKNPQMFCFNKNDPIHGGRVVARRTTKGYILEACVPLAFFKGLDLGSGKTARFDLVLDKGGEVSGYRILRLGYGGNLSEEGNPSTWPTAQWIGKIALSVPPEEEEDLYADLVEDGTRGATYAGIRTVSGVVKDDHGKPLSGVKISTWPETDEALTGAQGEFQLKKIKTYDRTVFYGRRDGYVTSLGVLAPHSKAVTLRLSPLPAELMPSFDGVSPFFSGLTIPANSPAEFDTMTSKAADLLKPLNPGVIRLSLASSKLPPEAIFPFLDKFVAYARQLGAEPMVVVPIDRADPEMAGKLVRYCNLEKNDKIRFWAVGDEPDINGAKNTNGDTKDYNAYDYVNDFRIIYDAMKREDPSILVLGPELAWKYAQGEEDWITPFVQYDGDIADGISLHHYATFQPSALLTAIPGDLRQDITLIRTLRNKISGNADLYLPVLVTSEEPCRSPVTAKSNDEAVSQEFWSALWEADKKGSFLEEHLAMDISSYPWDSASAGVSFQPKAAYWALKLWSQMNRGKVVAAQIQRPEMSVYATQDLSSKDVTLIIINKGDRYWRPIILLNGKESDLTVDAGLDQKYDFEIPSFSISRLKLKADRSPGESVIYTLKMAQAGTEPQASVIKPW